MRTRIAQAATIVMLALLLASTAGCSAFSGSGQDSAPAPSTMSAQSAVAPSPSTANIPEAAPSGGAGAQKGATSSTDRMVIMNGSMQMRVADLAGAIASVRKLTQTAGGTISDLNVTSNSESPAPVERQSASSSASIPGPASASITIRVPAARLADVQAQVGKLGTLVSQSANQSDVTQQHIDMTARLKNLRAEEGRLRALLARAGQVSDLLEVERELSRVRGDIESMQAQLTYLENQAAMATLTISLDEPGPVVRPSSGGWGLLDAVTTGIQGAAVMVRGLITLAIAFSPLIVLGVLIWLLVAWLVRRGRAKRAAIAASTDPAAPGDGTVGDADLQSSPSADDAD